MRFNIVTLFPEYFESPLKTSLLGKALQKGHIQVKIYNIRDHTPYPHNQCDDKPYGGGAGMVLMLVPVYNTLNKIREEDPETKIIYLSPQGKLLNFENVKEYAKQKSITLLCGHYEGIDYRIIEYLIDEEISIGDYVLTGGEPAALVFIDAVSRHIPGVVQKEVSVKEDSFENYLLKYPQYTKPREFKGMKVPEILLSGNHKLVDEWRKEMQIYLTKTKRPDLYKKFLERCRNEQIDRKS